MELVDGLPLSVVQVIEHLGKWAEGYGYLKWNEQDKIKADMMNRFERWWQVDADALHDKCRSVGLTEEETAKILDWLMRRKQRRRLVPSRSYKDFAFGFPVDEFSDEEKYRHSRRW